MHKLNKQAPTPLESAREEWEHQYRNQIGDNGKPVSNRSGIEIDPLYLPDGIHDQETYLRQQGFPGQFP